MSWFIMNTAYYLHSDMWVFGCCDKYRKVKPEFTIYEPEHDDLIPRQCEPLAFGSFPFCTVLGVTPAIAPGR